ncbi:MAG: hypothetical protein ACKORL_10340, partial [Phycisphaerales bacterium]
GMAGAADVAMLERYVRRYSCPGDLDASGTVNGVDLGRLLAAWGTCASACQADLNDDGVVDGTDIGMLIAGWGTCR